MPFSSIHYESVTFLTDNNLRSATEENILSEKQGMSFMERKYAVSIGAHKIIKAPLE